MKTIEYIVPKEYEGKTVEKILRSVFGLGGHRLASLKRVENGIMKNGEKVFSNVRCKEGEVLSFIKEDYAVQNYTPMADIPLDIVYEDDDLLVLNKQAGLATQGPPEFCPKTVASAFAYRYGSHAVFHPVNRLDKGTSGLMVVAKSGYIHDVMRKTLHTDFFVRKYYAVTLPAHPPEGVITLPIARLSDFSLKRVISENGVFAETWYKTVQQTERYSLLEITLKTGRTHQIRVHLSAIGYPIIGDFMYGTEDKSLIERPALHCFFVSFLHPVSHEKMEFFAPLPDDMKKLLEQK